MDMTAILLVLITSKVFPFIFANDGDIFKF